MNRIWDDAKRRAWLEEELAAAKAAHDLDRIAELEFELEELNETPMPKDCLHGFSSRDICPVCQHFGKILEAEALEREAAAAARKRKEEAELARLESDGPGD
jgi:hypothetical protein